MSSGYSPVKNQQRSLAYEESANESAFEGLAHPFELRVLVFALPIERLNKLGLKRFNEPLLDGNAKAKLKSQSLN